MLKKGARPKLKEVPPFEEFAALLVPLAKPTEIGIQNKMRPEEVVDYFIKVVGEFMKKMEKMGGWRKGAPEGFLADSHASVDQASSVEGSSPSI